MKKNVIFSAPAIDVMLLLLGIVSSNGLLCRRDARKVLCSSFKNNIFAITKAVDYLVHMALATTMYLAFK